MTEDEFREEIVSLVRDSSDRLSIPDDYTRCLARALERYSQDRPPAAGGLHTIATVYSTDIYAVCKLAAAEACGVLANAFIPSVDKFPQADFAGLQSKVDHYRARRRDLRQEYADHMNMTGAEADFVIGEIGLAWVEPADSSEL